MVTIINPFDAGGYTLTELTAAIQIIPNQYSRLEQLGLFRTEGITQRSVIVEEHQGVLNLLATAPLGSPATVGNRDTRKMRSFGVPWIPHNDVIVPQDIQGVRAFGSMDASDPLASVMSNKLTRMKRKHEQTREYMQINALKGVLKDGAGVTLYDWHAEFGTGGQQSVDFVLGTSTTDQGTAVRTVKRYLETHLLGESMTGIRVLCGPAFWDKFTTHATVKDAFKYYTANQQLMRDDLRGGFTFNGVVFEEYNATVTLADGSTTERLVADAEGIAFPLGTTDTYVQYNAPGNFMEAVNTIGQSLYSRQIARQDGSGIDVLTECSPLPIVKRPALGVRIFSSN